jgi:hypothetical protein
MKVIDPLAQSFYVEPESGIFVTSVDLYFQSKDEQLPVTIQLRPMQLGLPTQVVYPFSEIVLEPSQVNVSEDASVPTRVVFDSPIYLTGETFHSIVILANSDKYNVWVSKLGETNVSSESDVESNQFLVLKQPLLGGLFKSQNANTWNESPFEDLKFTLYRANFTQRVGNFNLYNSDLSVGNGQVSKLLPDSIEMTSKKIRVGLGTTVQDSDFTIGNTVYQKTSTGTGKYVGIAGTAKGDLKIINSGIGYTPSSGSNSFSGVALTSITGNGRNATANITINNGIAIAATISNGGIGYQVGDVLSVIQVGNDLLGRNLRLSVSELNGFNEIILDEVQGEFVTGVGNTVFFVNSSGISTELNSTLGGNVTIISNGVQTIDDGLTIKVNHKNHGMHAGENVVTISNVISDIKPKQLTASYEQSSTADIPLDDVTNLTTFENVGVGTTNPGYILIGNEIISYEGIVGNSLTGITREIDQTKAFSYSQGTDVYKYELNGISLRRINTNHTLQDSTLSDPLDLDYYTLKIDTTQDEKTGSLPQGQVDRSVEGYPKLFINKTKSTGGPSIQASQNIQFELLRPNIQTLILNSTNISASVRTVSGTSVDGNEISFIDKGFQDIDLNTNNYFDSPRLIASKVNETNNLTSLPGNKSFTVNLNMTSSSEYLSPVVDLDRLGMIFVSNRINSPIENYTTDNRIATLADDPSSFVYATNAISLETPASSIKILVAAHVNIYNDLRAFYSVLNDPLDDTIYYPFPGYSNLTLSGEVIDPSANDGTSDRFVPKVDILDYGNNESLFKDYEFTIDNLPSFRYFSIKLVGSSTNQAYPPRLKDLRVIALA